MNLQQLAVFREIMKTGSVSRAARNLHRTQPAVSASLKALEDDLGMPLFLREGRRLIPVPESHYLLSEASGILDRLKTVEQNLSNMRDQVQGSLSIVAMPGPSSYLLPEFISNFIEDKPQVKVTLATRSSPQILNLIAAQSFDIGFCDAAVGTEQDVLSHNTTIPCTCLCAVPKTSALANKKVIHAKDLDGVPMGVLQPSHSTFEATKAAFQSSDAHFDIRIDTQYFLPLFHFVEAGQICAVVDALSAVSYQRSRGDASKIVFLPFEPTVPFGYSILVPHQRPLSRLASSFVSSWQNWVEQTINQPIR
ncbi:LysR family transcriptional regulator [Pseudovibrio sp. Alg231-02]|uniref:LysR family transcriptional regulator n=1 Tax=Pseudovibrio sp. Alg231-02 TaxID=1922223 RepID=UPI000D55DEE0|nr:LysR family transcriptional regulator [Pseudovibrio sp. Alg231-02]